MLGVGSWVGSLYLSMVLFFGRQGRLHDPAVPNNPVSTPSTPEEPIVVLMSGSAVLDRGDPSPPILWGPQDLGTTANLHQQERVSMQQMNQFVSYSTAYAGRNPPMRATTENVKEMRNSVAFSNPVTNERTIPSLPGTQPLGNWASSISHEQHLITGSAKTPTPEDDPTLEHSSTPEQMTISEKTLTFEQISTSENMSTSDEQPPVPEKMSTPEEMTISEKAPLLELLLTSERVSEWTPTTEETTSEQTATSAVQSLANSVGHDASMQSLAVRGKSEEAAASSQDRSSFGTENNPSLTTESQTQGSVQSESSDKSRTSSHDQNEEKIPSSKDIIDYVYRYVSAYLSKSPAGLSSTNVTQPPQIDKTPSISATHSPSQEVLYPSHSHQSGSNKENNENYTDGRNNSPSELPTQEPESTVPRTESLGIDSVTMRGTGISSVEPPEEKSVWTTEITPSTSQATDGKSSYTESTESPVTPLSGASEKPESNSVPQPPADNRNNASGPTPPGLSLEDGAPELNTTGISDDFAATDVNRGPVLFPPVESEGARRQYDPTAPRGDLGPHRPNGGNDPNIRPGSSPPTDLGPQRPHGQFPPGSTLDLGPQRPHGQFPPGSHWDLGPQRPHGQFPPQMASASDGRIQPQSDPVDLGPHRPQGSEDPNGPYGSNGEDDSHGPGSDLGPQRPGGQMRPEPVVQEDNSCPDFHLFWNIPSFMCHRYGFNFSNLHEDFGIVQNKNDVFRGEKISILYDPGLYPAFVADDEGNQQPRNGGVPQEGNLTVHLLRLEEAIKDQVPEDFDGLGVIDFEAWRPQWVQNWGTLRVYQTYSVEVERKRSPKASNSTLKQRAKQNFESAAKEFFLRSLELAKKIRPKGKWGYYAFPYCFNQVANNPNYYCSESTQMQNDRIQWLFDASTAIYPSVYMSLADKTTQEEFGFIIGRLQEAARVANGRNVVYPYLWYRYHDVVDYIRDEDLKSSLTIPRGMGFPGAIMWGSSGNMNNAEKCDSLNTYVQETLGPAVVKYTSCESADEMQEDSNGLDNALI